MLIEPVPVPSDAVSSGALSGYLTTVRAARLLGVSLIKVQNGCRAYRYRIEGRTREKDPPQPNPNVDLTPLPHEIACCWSGSGRRLTYLINEATLGLHFVNRGGRRGRPVAGAKGAFVLMASQGL